MQIPKDLTHLAFGNHVLTRANASRAISFVWKGQECVWRFTNAKTNETFDGTNPKIGGRFLTINTEAGERQLPCYDVANPDPNDFPWSFTLIRQ